MTPLSEALTAAQKRALSALEKAYVAGQLDSEGLSAALNACGISDPVDLAYLASCLDVLNAWGAQVPAENGSQPAEQPASDKQTQLITDLIKRAGQGWIIPTNLSKAQASQVIDELQKGSYDPKKWQPF